MEDNTLYALIWKLAGAILLSVVAGITIHNCLETYMISTSVDPVAVKCATTGTYGSHACTIVAGRR